jgi:hypothetical protein
MVKVLRGAQPRCSWNSTLSKKDRGVKILKLWNFATLAMTLGTSSSIVQKITHLNPSPPPFTKGRSNHPLEKREGVK